MKEPVCDSNLIIILLTDIIIIIIIFNGSHIMVLQIFQWTCSIHVDFQWRRWSNSWPWLWSFCFYDLMMMMMMMMINLWWWWWWWWGNPRPTGPCECFEWPKCHFPTWTLEGLLLLIDYSNLCHPFPRWMVIMMIYCGKPILAIPGFWTLMVRPPSIT